MNKTVNINLAGIFFHIDEDAYSKLQRYLEAIKRSFTDSQGRSEIIADIEARIAELFNERIKNDKQVIRITEVDEVISIMGQPEDYLVDDEIFEDEPQQSYKSKSTHPKKLFRDAENSYISGVSAGLGHYFGIDAIWIRLAWILLIFGAGTGILLYILLWVLVPEAKTTTEKLMMRGEPVNISNIEKKIKDGFDSVTEKVGDVAKNVSDSVSNAAKNVDVKKGANSIKSSSRTFFDTLADIIMFFFKIIAKFIGIILIIVAAATLIGLIVGFLSLSIVDFINIPGLDLVDIANTGNSPIWLVSLFAFFAVGIPFFFLFYLGLKILINNLKSIGNIAKFSLLGLWLMSVIALIVIGVRQASEHAFEESYIERTEIPLKAKDTLHIKMLDNDLLGSKYYKGHRDFKLTHDENGNKIIFSSDITILVKSTSDSIATIAVEKSADGKDFDTAINRAKTINYNFNFTDNELHFDSFFTLDPEAKFSNQEISIILYLPEESIAYFSNSSEPFMSHRKHRGNIITRKNANHYMKIRDNDSECLDCPVSEAYHVDVNTPNVKINEDGIEVHADGSHLEINDQGIKAESDDVKVNIDSNGINIESED
ncbi:PspC domain-containing protein [Cognatitamlana onchidii]|uniref:PspC domain-containing protein n=1 Tax=Cognatitamlana onchidii TaxID=2562860 RepID=UPI0010A60630|nr:PspC domain-containing protein [Algibacter onchidii]